MRRPSLSPLLVLGFALVFASCQPAEAARKAGRRLGVVAGVRLPEDRLQFTLRDAQLMHDVLAGPDSDFTLLLSDSVNPNSLPTRDILLDAIRRKAAEAGPDDTLWIYFSGHGNQWTLQDGTKDGHSYILPLDFKQGRKESLISVSELRSELARISKARLTVLVLDACHSGSERSRPLPAVENVFGDAQGVATLAASRVDQVSWELPELRHGAFTFFLVRGLAGAARDSGSGDITLESLHRYVDGGINTLLTKTPTAQRRVQNPVFLIPGGQSNIPIAQPNPTLLASVPEPGASTPLKPAEPLFPGVIVSFAAGDGTDPSSVGAVEQRVRQALVKANFPVVSEEHAAGFQQALQSPDTAEAAAAAARMNSRFLLRGRVLARTDSMQTGSVTTHTAQVTIEVSLLDSSGRILITRSTDLDDGRPVQKPAFSASRALALALADASSLLVQMVLPEMEAKVRSRLNPSAIRAH